MTFEVEAGGTRRTIEIERGRGGWVVTVDGRAMSAIVNRTEARWSLLYGQNSENGDTTSKRSYEIVLEPRHRGEQLVHIGGRVVRVSFLDRGRRSSNADGGTSGAREIVAPMPGRIVKVLVQAGDQVSANQGLIVVEAMKMENELRTPRSGTVASVRVTEGMSVEANAVLVVVE